MDLGKSELNQAEWNESIREVKCVCKLINEKINISKMLLSRTSRLDSLGIRGKV